MREVPRLPDDAWWLLHRAISAQNRGELMTVKTSETSLELARHKLLKSYDLRPPADGWAALFPTQRGRKLCQLWAKTVFCDARW